MRPTRMTAVLIGSSTTVLLLAGPAAAHVTAHSSEATSGGSDAEISFRVPNEQSSVTTTKVVITFPTDQPFAGVMPAPKPGWKVASTSVKLATPLKTDDGDIDSAVSTITWTATAGGTPAGQYDDFDVAVGLLPTADAVTFKALQTYSNGDVVRWIETGDEPEHPAPVLSLGGATESGHGTERNTPTPTATASAKPAEAVEAGDDSSATALGAAGLGLGAVSLVLAAVALARTRRP